MFILYLKTRLVKWLIQTLQIFLSLVVTWWVILEPGCYLKPYRSTTNWRQSSGIRTIQLARALRMLLRPYRSECGAGIQGNTVTFITNAPSRKRPTIFQKKYQINGNRSLINFAVIPTTSRYRGDPETSKLKHSLIYPRVDRS